jgi:hypothetical protein
MELRPIFHYHRVDNPVMDETEGSPHWAPQALKTTKDFDGETDANETFENEVLRNGVRLHPQLTCDPLDPLNWSRWRKLLILGIVMWM